MLLVSGFNLPAFQPAFSGAGTEKGNQDSLPVVILLGWAGCKDRHLAKYSSIYLKEVSSSDLVLP